MHATSAVYMPLLQSVFFSICLHFSVACILLLQWEGLSFSLHPLVISILFLQSAFFSFSLHNFLQLASFFSLHSSPAVRFFKLHAWPLVCLWFSLQRLSVRKHSMVLWFQTSSFYSRRKQLNLCFLLLLFHEVKQFTKKWKFCYIIYTPSFLSNPL